MTIETTVTDINGNSIELGDLVCAYAQEYKEISRETFGDVVIVEEDREKPLPIRDVPLFTGYVRWNQEQLKLEIEVLETLSPAWDSGVSRATMGGGHYVYQLLEEPLGGTRTSS